MDFEEATKEHDILNSDDMQLEALGMQQRLAEAPEELAAGDGWQAMAAKKWRRKEHITALESEAALFVVRSLCRTIRVRIRRHFILSDSMVLVCADNKDMATP